MRCGGWVRLSTPGVDQGLLWYWDVVDSAGVADRDLLDGVPSTVVVSSVAFERVDGGLGPSLIAPAQVVVIDFASVEEGVVVAERVARRAGRGWDGL